MTRRDEADYKRAVQLKSKRTETGKGVRRTSRYQCIKTTDDEKSTFRSPWCCLFQYAPRSLPLVPCALVYTSRGAFLVKNAGVHRTCARTERELLLDRSRTPLKGFPPSPFGDYFSPALLTTTHCWGQSIEGWTSITRISTITCALRYPLITLGASNPSALYSSGHKRKRPADRSGSRENFFCFRVYIFKSLGQDYRYGVRMDGGQRHVECEHGGRRVHARLPRQVIRV